MNLSCRISGGSKPATTATRRSMGAMARFPCGGDITYPLGLRHLAEMMAARGPSVDHSTVPGHEAAAETGKGVSA
jgi:transposase-like protein